MNENDKIKWLDNRVDAVAKRETDSYERQNHITEDAVTNLKNRLEKEGWIRVV